MSKENNAASATDADRPCECFGGQARCKAPSPCPAQATQEGGQEQLINALCEVAREYGDSNLLPALLRDVLATTPTQDPLEGHQDLPPLPEAFITLGDHVSPQYDDDNSEEVYTADQMRDYARAAVALYRAAPRR